MKKTIAIGVIAVAVIIGFLFVNGILEVNQENLDESLQNMPEGIKEAGETAKDLAVETSTILRESISQQIENVQLKPVENTVDDIAKIPRQIQENNPLNEKTDIAKISEVEELFEKWIQCGQKKIVLKVENEAELREFKKIIDHSSLYVLNPDQ